MGSGAPAGAETQSKETQVLGERAWLLLGAPGDRRLPGGQGRSSTQARERLPGPEASEKGSQREQAGGSRPQPRLGAPVGHHRCLLAAGVQFGARIQTQGVALRPNHIMFSPLEHSKT